MPASPFLVGMLINMRNCAASLLIIGFHFFPGLGVPTHPDLQVRRHALRWSPTAPYGFFFECGGSGVGASTEPLIARPISWTFAKNLPVVVHVILTHIY